MENCKLVAEVARKFETMINKRSDADYQINHQNWQKLLSVLDYLDTETKRLGGKLEPVHLTPKEQHAYIEAIFDVFDVYGGSMKAFAAAIRLVDVFSIEPLANGKLRIGLNINFIYEKKYVQKNN